MSIPTERQAYAFLGPLRGNSSAFLVAGKKGNMIFTTFVLACVARLRMTALMLDTSCFYTSHIERLTSKLPRAFLERSRILTISEGKTPQDVISALLTREEAKVVLIDDLNSLNALMGRGDRTSSSHELFVLIRLLSYTARIHNTPVLASVYKSHGTNLNSRRSLAASTDLQVNTEAKPSYIAFKCDKTGVWPNKSFTAIL